MTAVVGRENGVIDLAAAIQLVVYQGFGVGRAGRELGTSGAKVREALQSPQGQKLMERAMETRMEMLLLVPIANPANRYRRLEKIYKGALRSGDFDTQLKSLAAARDEEKLLRGITDATGAQAQITVNIGEYRPDEASVEGEDGVVKIVETEFSVEG